ncbi:hypothetical protein SESBI_42416 [Sesbania bispinosa]|nr:hypothetical protein SESBI_42416 [Sesbania bispinosa]
MEDDWNLWRKVVNHGERRWRQKGNSKKTQRASRSEAQEDEDLLESLAQSINKGAMGGASSGGCQKMRTSVAGQGGRVLNEHHEERWRRLEIPLFQG